MYEQLLEELIRLEPKSWEDLSNGAKLLRTTYHNQANTWDEVIHRVTQSPEPSTTLSENLTWAVASSPHFKNQENRITAIYLAAKAADIDQIPGNFDSKDHIKERILEILGLANILETFSLSAQMMTYTQMMDPYFGALSPANEASSDKSISVALNNMFEKPKRIRADFKELGHQVMTIKTDTAVKVIKEEIGILPEPVERMIRSTFNPEAGLK